jgi:N-acetyl-1-D-myo-inositol-2-amino-2-deoxy-alpha-D-glucopyranoside deacetylase
MTWVTPSVAGPAPDSPAEALSRAPLDEVVADVVAAARRWRADAIISYDAQGGYGHPDHVRCHHAAEQAARELGLPFWEIVEGEAADSAQGEVFEADPDLDRLIAAHRAYPSQFTVSADGFHLTHVGGQPDRVVASAKLRRA